MYKRTISLKLDFYTKTVLTVIAICLIGILLRPIFMPIQAEAGSDIQDVNIAKINGSYLSSSSATIRVEVVK